MRLPHCDSVADLEVAVSQATVGLAQSPAMEQAVAATVAAAIDATRDR